MCFCKIRAVNKVLREKFDLKLQQQFSSLSKNILELDWICIADKICQVCMATYLVEKEVNNAVVSQWQTSHRINVMAAFS